ncbi:MAG TPA: D-aminoacyl-tRNA deacylase [Chloroflexota bacterium]
MVRVVLQRVSEASVNVDDRVVGYISRGYLLLVGISHSDTEVLVARVADKVSALRLFSDSEGKMNLSLADVGGSALVVSQFTLYGDVRRGRRPSFTAAADPEIARHLYHSFADRLAERGHPVAYGEFGAHMVVRIVNDGPVTMILDSETL